MARGVGVSDSGAATVFHRKRPRVPKEKYYTPSWATAALFKEWTPRRDTVWEPAAGDGGMAAELMRHYILTWATDIAPEHQFIHQLDFLDKRAHLPPGAWDVVSNPPYGHQGALAVRFIKRALELTKPHGGSVAMLLRDDFDSAPGRVSLFGRNLAWDRKVVLTERIRWSNLPQLTAGPSGNHAWFVWDWQRDPDEFPSIHYVEVRTGG